MFANKSAIVISILFVVTISSFGLDVNSESVDQPNDVENSTGGKTTESPKIDTTTIEVIPDLDSRYGIDAPSATLIQCEANQKYQDGACKERSNL